MKHTVAVVVFALVTSPALGAAVTYSGTIGKTPIVVEFTAPPAEAQGPFAGRYFYASRGIDIPLDAVRVQPGKLELTEERPCTEEICQQADDGTITGIPVGAKWQLSSGRDTKTLTGTWTENGRQQPVALTLVGSRDLPADSEISPLGLAAISTAFIYGDQRIAEDTAPYDYLRMQTKQQESPIMEWLGSSFRYLTDPRTKFKFPAIVELADGSDPAAANAYLQDRHWAMNADAFNCEAQQYGGLGWSESVSYSAGTLGGYPDETIAVTALTPALMSWTESGSLFCGGAHPYNHHEFFNLDVKTGEPLDMSRIFAGWVARDFDGNVADTADARTHPQDFQWGPDKALGDFVKAHRAKNGDVALNEDCNYDELIDSNLAINFKTPDRVLFALGGLENAIEACGADLYEAPVADLNFLLTPEAVDYLPSLAD